MYTNELKMLIEKIVIGNIEKKKLEEYLIDNFDCELIYETDEELITDSYFSLKHYASGEEDISQEEWLFFLECLEGRRKYNANEKMRITTKPPHRQA